MPGQIFIICGVSGSGKSTISDAIMDRHPNVVRAVAVTTRFPREGESYAYHYYFVDQERFQWLVDTNQLLEYTVVYHNQSYGTLKLAVDQALERGHDVLFVVDSVGVEQIEKFYPNARSVFLKAPSDEEQRKRLTTRGTVGEDLEDRITKAHAEQQWAESRGMNIIVNDVVEETIEATERVFNLA